jgi:DNA invertase Pin-like site-specific DNA recombinase
MTRRVVLGLRTSTEDKNQDPQNQLGPLEAAMARLGWTVAEVVVIEGLSAWNPKTAAEVKRRFLAPIVEGRADTLAVWALDRVVRGGIEPTLAFIRELEQHLGASLFSLQEPWASSATQDRATRELVASMMAWVAQQESERKSQRVRAKVRAKRNRARVLGQSAKWGKGVLATPEQMRQVLAMRGVPVRAVARQLGLSKSQVHRIRAGQLQVPEEPPGLEGAPSVAEAPSDGAPSGQLATGGGA